jgi:hypothetical protein
MNKMSDKKEKKSQKACQDFSCKKASRDAQKIL